MPPREEQNTDSSVPFILLRLFCFQFCFVFGPILLPNLHCCHCPNLRFWFGSTYPTLSWHVPNRPPYPTRATHSYWCCNFLSTKEASLKYHTGFPWEPYSQGGFYTSCLFTMETAVWGIDVYRGTGRTRARRMLRRKHEQLYTCYKRCSRQWASDLWKSISSVQSLSRVGLFVTPWTGARQASLSITNSQSLLKLMSIELGDAIQPSHPLLSPSPPALNPSQH